jgi:hypothetical protein
MSWNGPGRKVIKRGLLDAVNEQDDNAQRENENEVIDCHY